jgi:antitoxin CcdA
MAEAEKKRLSLNEQYVLKNGPGCAERQAAWKAENRAAIESLNQWVKEHGMPYDEYRHF